MKRYRIIMISVLLFAAGCAGRESAPLTHPAAVQIAPKTGSAEGTVAVSNLEHHFVVLDFGGNPLPSVGTELSIYRGQKSIGRLRITEPSRGHMISGDVLAGKPKVGDVVRAAAGESNQ